MEKLTLKRYRTEGYDNFRIPGIVCTESGKILVYYESRKSASDWAAIDIAMKESTDGGKTWSEDKVLACGEGKTVDNPVMFADGREIVFMWQEEYHRTFYRKSYDEGASFSEPIEITESTRTAEYDWTVIACGPGHGTVLKNGRYIVPVWLCSNHSNPKAHHPSIISTLYSDDKGRTWKLGELLGKNLADPSETALAQLEDGSVMINVRHECSTKRRAIAFSPDGSGSWSELYFEEALPDPTCMAGMISRDGKVYFVNCSSETDRRNLTIHISDDSGKSWKKAAVLSDPAGYSDIAMSPDGSRIYVFFEEFDDTCDHYDLVLITLDTDELKTEDWRCAESEYFVSKNAK